MGIRFNETTKLFEVSYIKRHPITRQPRGLKRIGIKTKTEAQRVYNDLVVKVNSKLEAPPPGTILYKDLLTKFFQSLLERDLAVMTVENYKLCLNVHTAKIWGQRPIETIQTEEIRHLIKVTLSKRTPSSQKSMLKYVRSVFNYAVECGLLLRNPVPKMQFRLGDKIKKVLTKQQAKIFLERAKHYNHPWYPIWVTALYTGMRNGELYALTWDKVDFERNSILVSSSWDKKAGFKQFTKSGEDRVIDIAPPLKIVLSELKLSNSDSVFVLPRIQEWDDGRQAELLRQFLAGVNLPQVRFHDLRATWATMLLSEGLEPVKVMKLGGWKDIKTMMIYTRKAGIDTQGALNSLSIHNATTDKAKTLQLKAVDCPS